MKKKMHKNEVKVVIPEYETIREIVVKGTAAGGDRKQFMFLDKNKEMKEINYNQTWKLISSLGTYFFSKGLKGGKKIALISENVIEWAFAYYAILVGGNVCVPMDAKLSHDDLEDQLIRCDCDGIVYSGKFAGFAVSLKSNPAINTKDAMTATIEEIPYAVLHKITDSITHEVDGINRVLLDLTPKPIGTIEWE